MSLGDKVPKGDPCARRSRSEDRQEVAQREEVRRVLEIYGSSVTAPAPLLRPLADPGPNRVQHDVADGFAEVRSEEHTSELQSHSDLVCRLLLEKKKK